MAQIEDQPTIPTGATVAFNLNGGEHIPSGSFEYTGKYQGLVMLRGDSWPAHQVVVGGKPRFLNAKAFYMGSYPLHPEVQMHVLELPEKGMQKLVSLTETAGTLLRRIPVLLSRGL